MTSARQGLKAVAPNFAPNFELTHYAVRGGSPALVHLPRDRCRLPAMSKSRDKSVKFEDAIADLESIIERIESGQIGLEECIAEYERGMKLAGRCQEILDTVQKKIAELALDEGKLRVKGGGPDGDSGGNSEGDAGGDAAEDESDEEVSADEDFDEERE